MELFFVDNFCNLLTNKSYNIKNIYMRTLILMIFLLLTNLVEGQNVKDSVDAILVKYSSEHSMNADFNAFFENNNKAYNLSKKVGYKLGVSRSASNLAMVYESQQDYTKSLTYAEEGYKIGVEIKDTFSIANSMLEIGNVYYYTNDLDKAIINYEKVYVIGQKSKDPMIMGDACALLARLYMSIDSIPTAFSKLNQANSYYSQTSDCSKSAFTFLSMGKIQGKYFKNADSARYYIDEARNIAIECGDRPNIALSLVMLSDLMRSEGNFNKSEEYLSLALKEMDGYNDDRSIHNIYLKLSRINVEQNDFKKAYYNLLSAYSLKDSIMTNDKIKEITTLKLSTDFEKEKEVIALKTKQEQEVLEQKISKERVIKNMFIISAILFGFIIILVYRSYKSQRTSNIVILHQKEKIENQHKEITDSIKYAQGIQNSILPVIPQAYLNNVMFVHYQPKDIVSGDFYWFKDDGVRVFIAVADCTGHGVPGALMSMINHDLLENAVREHNDPGNILTFVNTKLSEKMSAFGRQDGMDISLVVINKGNGQMFYAGAKRNLYVVKQGSVSEIEADKCSIGGNTNVAYEFSTKLVDIERGDMVYLTTDGYIDQFGGEKNKKYGSKRFRDFISSTSKVSMAEQSNKFSEEFESWKDQYEQTDDVCIIGIKA